MVVRIGLGNSWLVNSNGEIEHSYVKRLPKLVWEIYTAILRIVKSACALAKKLRKSLLFWPSGVAKTSLYLLPQYFANKIVNHCNYEGDYFFKSPDSLHDPIRKGGDTKVDSFHLKIVETPIAVSVVARPTNYQEEFT